MSINPSDHFPQLERISRLNVRMYDLTRRERDVCEVIIDRSFARRRTTAVFQSQLVLAELAGLYPGDLSDTVKLLIVKGIVVRRGPRDAREFEFLPFAKYWQETIPRFDVTRAIAIHASLDRLESQGKLPVQEPDLDDAMAEVSRDNAIAHDNELRAGAAEKISNSLTNGGTPAEISESLISERDGADTSRVCTRERDVTLNDNVVTLRNVEQSAQVGTKKRFADPEKNYVLEQLEEFADAPDYQQYRGKWIKRVDQSPSIVLRAVVAIREFVEAGGKITKSRGAAVFRKCQAIARERNISFHLW